MARALSGLMTYPAAIIMKCAFLFFAILTAPVTAADSPPIVINEERIHLGVPGSPEWEWFENDPARPGRLDLPFRATAQAGDTTLLIRQDDVKQEWPVEL